MSTHKLLLRPTDVLFFRDGRRMGGSLAGHTAAWPLPDVTNHALHAALHRAALEGVHSHRQGRSGEYPEEHRDRKFGSLKTTGPFPVNASDCWYFPRPKDAALKQSSAITLQPIATLSGIDKPWVNSSLPKPLQYAVVNTQPPSKDDVGEPWISKEAYEAYLKGDANDTLKNIKDHFLKDTDIADTEYSIGIGIDSETGTTGSGEAAGKIYSAQYLRLRDEFRLGLLAQAMDKGKDSSGAPIDLMEKLINNHPQSLLVGGQQRMCSAERQAISGTLPLPQGINEGFKTSGEGDKKLWLIKWILLSPAIWPEIEAGESKRGTVRKSHPGGWLPNWICQESGNVLLEEISPDERKNRRSLNYQGKGYESNPNISARLVAAIVPKPIVVTGWALPNEADPEKGGAKSTHLAVPAGAVYYFEADSEENAKNLATALNWHGDTGGAMVKNRRSTLLGEKGYGLGIVGTWDFYKGNHQS